MSTPVQGGPAGPLGYAPRRTREAGTAGANTASPLQELGEKPPRTVVSTRDDLDSGPSRDAPSSPHDAPPSRDSLPIRDTPPARGASTLRDALSARDAQSTRPSSLPSRGAAPLRDALSSREGLTPREAPPSRENPLLRSTLPPRDAASSRDVSPPPRETAPMRSALPPRDGVPSREAPLPSRENPLLRNTLPPRDAAPSRDVPPPSRETAPMRSALPPRDGLPPPPRETPLRGSLSSLDGLPSREAPPLREPPPPRSSLSSLDGMPPRSPLPLRNAPPARDALPLRDAPPRRSTLMSREAPSSSEAPSLRDTLSLQDGPLARDAVLPPLPPGMPAKGGLVPSSGPRDLLDDAVELDLAPSRDAASRWDAGPSKTSRNGEAAAASGTDTTWKRKKRSPEAFEGDTALKELRTRLASAPTDQAPEPPLAPAKGPIFGSAMRLVGVVGLAAGGALGFLWITSPHGPRSANPPSDEAAVVSLKLEPSKAAPLAKTMSQNLGAEQTPDTSSSSRSADAPWAVANYPSDAAERAVTPPVTPQPRTAGPPRSPVARVPAPSQPAPAVVAPSPPAPSQAPAAVMVPAAITAPAVVMAPQVAVAPSLDRDEISAMLVRARTFLASGDVAAARVALRRAAERDDPQAALALGGTYDPIVLKKLGIISFRHADPALAREWYRKAAALGSADASLRLEQMVQTDH
jgi:hypothetical protein